MKEKDLIFQLKKGLGLTNVQLGNLLSLIANYSDNLKITNGNGITITTDDNNKGHITIAIDAAILEQINTNTTQISQCLEKINNNATQISQCLERITALENKTISWNDIQDKPDLSQYATTELVNTKADTSQTIKKITLTGSANGSIDVAGAAVDAQEITITTTAAAN